MHLRKFTIQLMTFICFASWSLSATAAFDTTCDLNLTNKNHGTPETQAKSNIFLRETIEKNLQTLPRELSSCTNTTGAWYEFLRGLAKIESDGKCDAKGDTTGAIGARGGSNGIFQMTAGDKCGASGKPLSDPNNAQNNIECAVQEWKQIVGINGSGKILGNPYWGPCKRSEKKCLDVIEHVKNSQECRGVPGAGALDWQAINPGGSEGQRGSQSGAAAGNR